MRYFKTKPPCPTRAPRFLEGVERCERWYKCDAGRPSLAESWTIGGSKPGFLDALTGHFAVALLGAQSLASCSGHEKTVPWVGAWKGPILSSVEVVKKMD